MTKTIEELKKAMEDAEAACKSAKLAWRNAECKSAKLAWRNAEGVAHTATFIYINALKEAK